MNAFISVIFLLLCHVSAQWIDYSANGTATMTHYEMPRDYIASCGCTGDSTHFPTAALSQMAYGSSTAYGPGCGRCFLLTLLNTFTTTPPYFPVESKSIVIKVTDLCPLSENGWCSGTQDKTNPGGQYLNFDLVYPSAAIPDDFYPSNASLYGYTDYGVWNVSYASVPCTQWAGWKDASALGSVAALDTSGCCPADPTASSNDTCPSYSDDSGLPPDTITSQAIPMTLSIPSVALILLSFLLTLLL